MSKLLTLLYLLLAIGGMKAQMNIDGRVLYGNEWLENAAEYIRFSLDEDGIYKVTYEELVSQGIASSQLNGSHFQMFYFGNEIPIYTSSEGQWSPGDYLMFYGQRNDGELDKQHYGNWEEEQLNPYYSLYSDNSTYYLAWHQPGPHERYRALGNDLSGNLPPLQPFYMHRERQVYYDTPWTPVAPEEPDAEYSHFIVTEGFGDKVGPTHSFNYTVSEIYTNTSENATLKLRTGSNNQFAHIVNIYFNNDLLEIDSYSKNKIREYEFPLTLADLKPSSTLRLETQGISDNIIVGYTELCYPRHTIANGQPEFAFGVSPGQGERLFEIEAFDGGSENFVFDIENGVVITPQYSNGVARFRYPSQPRDGQLILANLEKSVRSVSGTSKFRYESIDDMDPEYLILTSAKLNNSDSLNGMNPIEEYASYRASNFGGSYETAVINVEDIYDQFGYGIQGHSQALQNFAMYVKTAWPDLELAFIIGKGLSYINRNRNSAFTSFVPSYGKPGSDNLIFSEDDRSSPFIGVGRLAAHTPEDVLVYLDKVREHESTMHSINDRIWRKNVLHLSGGDPRIQDFVYNTLDTMGMILETNKFGANVTTFKKTSTDPVQTSLSQSIINHINDGLGIMTFFGHSSAGTFDFSIEDPSKYNNGGRYPVVFSLGCHSGDIHEAVFSLSEDFILTPDRGAIAFVASSGNAFIFPLSDFGKGIYRELGSDFYGAPLGLLLTEILKQQNNPLNARTISLHQQNTLHGDPAIRLYAPPGPDYVVDFSSIKTEKDIGTLDPTIHISFDIINVGMGVQDSIDNYLIHSYGEDQQDTFYFSSIAPYNRTTVVLDIPNPGSVALGKNLINIVLDHNERVAEWPDPDGELNNDLKNAWMNEGYCFFIFDNSAFPVYPNNFGIVYKQDVALTASSTNAFGKKEYFLMELDTTEEFDSPFLQQTEILSSPALIRWQPGIPFENERVYYWRVAPKDNSGQVKWNTSSFVYLEDGSEGWNQSHLYQWQKDDFETFEFDSDTRSFEFAEDLKEIRIKNGSFRITRPSISYQNHKSEYIEFDSHIDAGVLISTFDGETGVPRTNEIPALYGSYFSSPWAIDYLNFPYRTDTREERAKAINFIENVVPDGDYIVIYTLQRGDIGTDYMPEEWAADAQGGDPDLFSVLEKYGAQRVRELENGARPYIFAFKKNDTTFTPIESVAAYPTETIEAQFKITGRWHEGSVSSTRVGPALAWKQFQWEMGSVEPGADSYRLDLYGIERDGDEVVLFQDIQDTDLDISMIDAMEYPQLRLEFYGRDSMNFTSPQLGYWRILYDEIPEAVLNVDERFVFRGDTVFLGNNLELKTRATNISQSDMDSLLVLYTILDEGNQEINVFDRLAPLPAGADLDIDFTYPTDQLSGLHEFRVEINPDKDQPEQYSFNNIGIVDFEVLGDNINPVLDVTFDGIRIMDGDIVSPTPLITIILKDENEFLYVQDVSHFDLAIQKLPNPQSTTIDLNQSNITFYPADSTNKNLAKLEYLPELETGEYILYVQAEDVTGNLSGDQTLEIRFRVVEESQVSSVLNYPNPFSTRTEFVFTLTGHEVPDVFNIQIMTLSGKIVREITKNELGPLRIGINRSAYKWDGTDAYGNKLANGVYLYRVMTSYNGESFDHFSNDKIDPFFKHGFGKLVIMR